MNGGGWWEGRTSQHPHAGDSCVRQAPLLRLFGLMISRALQSLPHSTPALACTKDVRSDQRHETGNANSDGARGRGKARERGWGERERERGGGVPFGSGGHALRTFCRGDNI